jgi:chemotaxis protein MotB
MQEHGMRQDQVTQVRGFADQSLRAPDKPEDASNRRITLIIQYQKATPADLKPEPKAGEGKPGEAKPAEAKPAEVIPSPVGTPVKK